MWELQKLKSQYTDSFLKNQQLIKEHQLVTTRIYWFN
jgi:hypothetical protein